MNLEVKQKMGVKSNPLRAKQFRIARKKSNEEKKQNGLVERKYWLKASNAEALAAAKLKLEGKIINGIRINEIGNILDLFIEQILDGIIEENKK